MSNPRYSQELKDEAVRQVTGRKYPANEVAERLGIPTTTLYIWIRKAAPTSSAADELAASKKEVQKLKAELRRVHCKEPRVKYAFIRPHRHEHQVAVLCHVLPVHRSGFYAWLNVPQLERALEDARLLPKIRRFHQESGGAYGSPRIFNDLREEARLAAGTASHE